MGESKARAMELFFDMQKAQQLFESSPASDAAPSRHKAFFKALKQSLLDCMAETSDTWQITRIMAIHQWYTKNRAQPPPGSNQPGQQELVRQQAAGAAVDARTRPGQLVHSSSSSSSSRAAAEVAQAAAAGTKGAASSPAAGNQGRAVRPQSSGVPMQRRPAARRQESALPEGGRRQSSRPGSSLGYSREPAQVGRALEPAQNASATPAVPSSAVG
jgi:hypothetical protein